MSRTQSRVDSDQPYNDGVIHMGAIDFAQLSGASTLTKIATGEYSYHVAASVGAFAVLAQLTGAMFRIGVQDDLQEFYGSLRAGGASGKPIGAIQTLTTGSLVAGAPVNMAVANSGRFFVGNYVTIDTVASTVQEFALITAIPDATHITVQQIVNAHASGAPVSQGVWTTPASISGRPPYTGVTQFTPPINRPKGIAIKAVSLAYLVTGASFTVPTVGLFSMAYANNIAPALTTLIAQGTNGLQTAAQANPYVTYVPLAVQAQPFIITPNTIVTMEIDGNTGAGTTFDLLGVDFIVDYNFC